MVSIALLISAAIQFEIAYVRAVGEQAELVIRKPSGQSTVINRRKLFFHAGNTSGNWGSVHNDRLRRSFAFSTDANAKKFFLLQVLDSWQDSTTTEWTFNSKAKLITLNRKGVVLSEEPVTLFSGHQYFLGDTGQGRAGLIRRLDWSDLSYSVWRGGRWVPAGLDQLPRSFQKVVNSHRVPPPLSVLLEPVMYHDLITLGRQWVDVEFPMQSGQLGTTIWDSVAPDSPHFFYDGESFWTAKNGMSEQTTSVKTRYLFFPYAAPGGRIVASRMAPNQLVGLFGNREASLEYQKYYVWAVPPFIASRLLVWDSVSGFETEIGNGFYGFALP